MNQMNLLLIFVGFALLIFSPILLIRNDGSQENDADEIPLVSHGVI